MEKKIQNPKEASTPQLKVRTNVSAGGSLEACQNNLEYWRNAYQKKCLFR